MNYPNDDFLHDLYEEPRPEFADHLWRDLQEMSEEEQRMLTIARRNGHVGAPVRKLIRPLVWIAASLLALVSVALAAYLMPDPVDEGVHFANLNQGTPTAVPTATPDMSLATQGVPLPETVLTLGSFEAPIDFTLDVEHPIVRLHFQEQDSRFVTLEAYASQSDIVVRVSRDADGMLQPFVLYKPTVLMSMPLEVPIFYPATTQSDLIVELVTPLTGDEQVTFSAYEGTRWISMARSALTVNCLNYPQYCVPFASGGTDDFADVEASGARQLDAPSVGAENVVRGLNTDQALMIGDPQAPLHVAVFIDFFCPYCTDYYFRDLRRFMQDYVLTGQASVEIYFTSLYGPISVRGHQTVLAAGEQGASWEMLENLLRVAQSQGIGMLTPEAINVVAYELGLDVDALNAVIDSGRYDDTLASYKNLFDELGLQGVPSVAVYVDGEWQVQQDWSYEALAELVAQ